MPNGGDDRHGARGDGPDDDLLAEREQVFEAAAAAGEDDDVHLWMRGDAPERGGDPQSCTAPLHAGLGDDDVDGREPRSHACDHIAAGGRVRPRDDSDRARKARQGALPLGGEEAFRGQLALQPLDSREVAAEPDPLDRESAEAELALRLVDLCLALDEHALAVRQLERELVEAAPLHRGAQARAGRRVLEREEHERPRLVPAEVGDLALDPERGQPAQVDADPLR